MINPKMQKFILKIIISEQNELIKKYINSIKNRNSHIIKIKKLIKKLRII